MGIPLPEDHPGARRLGPLSSRPTTSASAAPTSRPSRASTPTTAMSSRSRASSQELDLRSITLVVQDWGGPIGFRFAVENPERIARLVVLNTGIGARAPNDEWLRFQAFMRRVGTDIVAGQLLRLALVQPVTDEVIAAYDAPFPVPESRVGIVQFPELVPTSPQHPNAARMLEVREELRSFDRPALILFSRQRPDLSPSRRRGVGGAPPERPARSAGARRGPFPSGRPGRDDRTADCGLRRLTRFIRVRTRNSYAGGA